MHRITLQDGSVTQGAATAGHGGGVGIPPCGSCLGSVVVGASRHHGSCSWPARSQQCQRIVFSFFFFLVCSPFGRATLANCISSACGTSCARVWSCLGHCTTAGMSGRRAVDNAQRDPVWSCLGHRTPTSMSGARAMGSSPHAPVWSCVGHRAPTAMSGGRAIRNPSVIQSGLTWVIAPRQV